MDSKKLDVSRTACWFHRSIPVQHIPKCPLLGCGKQQPDFFGMLGSQVMQHPGPQVPTEVLVLMEIVEFEYHSIRS